MRKKSQFKLRFHHQALPQEYLDHYEATQNNLQNKQALAAKALSPALKSLDCVGQSQHTNESVRSWLQKISEFHGEKRAPSATSTHDDRNTASSSQPAAVDAKKQSRVVSYSDLPYMGEMTLENSKPRRGRKPKKADICHLIYKNYGTILPGTPKMATENNEKSTPIVESSADSRKTELQNKIISSLLEKRLQEGAALLASPPSIVVCPSASADDSPNKLLKDEPLNLCVRDRSDTLTVSSADDDLESVLDSSRSTPLISQLDLTTDALLAANLKMSLPNFHSALLEKMPSSSNTPSTTSGGDLVAPNGYVYWPRAGVFIHPMALYYQKMVDAGTSVLPMPTSSPSPMPSSSGVKNPSVDSQPMSGLSSNIKNGSSGKILVPKNISQLLKQEKTSPSLMSSKTLTVPKAPSEASSTSSKSTNQSAIKRKRSAIFIPPMPNESSTNHATEVSICKFKFTGGAKPSLQEKKMLSVDAGGNFRYYSGTGDKSIRGYEFFPRESLHQASLTTASSAGAFLNTPGKRIPVDLSPPSHGLSNELLQIPELANAGMVGVMPAPVVTPQPPVHHHHRASHSSDRRKRKSRRSLQREKLEKTFKEKGFLIQTQQLESAEGATYCKFRQLRKFTRYLFRSWKDYLPGELQQGVPINPTLQHVVSPGATLEDLNDIHPSTAGTSTSHLATAQTDN